MLTEYSFNLAEFKETFISHKCEFHNLLSDMTKNLLIWLLMNIIFIIYIICIIYIKNSSKFKERTDLTIFEDGIFESIFIEIENINSAKTLIGVLYRPPNHANRDIF